jgi:ABC-type amino acid transport system permease subunit
MESWKCWLAAHELPLELGHLRLEQVKGGEETYLDWLATGLGWTLAVSLTAWLLALLIGIGS